MNDLPDWYTPSQETPTPPNDPKHWAGVALAAHPTWQPVKLIPEAIAEFLEFRNWEIIAKTFLQWEDQVVAMQPDSPCVEKTTIRNETGEFTRAFILCHECQETLDRLVRSWFSGVFLPIHPEWNPPNPAGLLAAIDQIKAEQENARAAAEFAKNPQLKLFEF